MRLLSSRIVLACLAVLGVATLAQPAKAGPVYSFTKITNNGNPDVGSQLQVEVIDAGVVAGISKVTFKFTNSAVIASSITDLYWDDGTLLGITTVTDSGAGVAFDAPATPGDLPGGNAVNFNTTVGFSADSAPPVSQNGVDSSSEWVAVTFNLINGKTYADTLAALALSLQTGNVGQDVTGGLRIGLHVQAIGPNSGSDSYVNGPQVNPVPAPAGLVLLLSAAPFAVFGRAIRRRLTAAKA